MVHPRKYKFLCDFFNEALYFKPCSNEILASFNTSVFHIFQDHPNSYNVLKVILDMSSILFCYEATFFQHGLHTPFIHF